MKMLLLVIGLAVAGVASGQQAYNGLPSLVWPKLYNISYEKAKDDLGAYDKPLFSEPVKKLAGKTISLPGYIVPFENSVKAAHFMLSSLPLNACFFCGVGGPETVIEVYLDDKISYTEKPVEVRGTLRLNDADPDKLFYILEHAEVLGEVRP